MDRPVLLLNANYEPLNVCNTRRAVGLVMMDKAEIILNGRGVIRTPSTTFLRPSVIRLSYMIHRPRARIKLTKKEILRRDNYMCQYCGQRTHRLTIDHVKPRRLGGVHWWHNVVAACPACNHRKGGRTVNDAHMKLLRQPREPQATAAYLFGGYLENNQDWRVYIEGW
jgi:5-methylcytosine-specific restriction endonuclease McrA